MTTSEEPGGAVGVTLTATRAAACTTVPLVPLTVTLKAPAAAPEGTATVIVATPLPAIACGASVTVVPAGAPLAVRSTRPAFPFNDPTNTEKVAVAPGA